MHRQVRANIASVRIRLSRPRTALLRGLLALLACGCLGLLASGSAAAAVKRPPAHRAARTVTVPRTLAALLRRKRISTAQYHHYLNEWVGDLREEQSLSGWRRAQLTDVTVQLHDLTAAGQMSAPRLPALFMTLQRNAQYWKAGNKLVYGDRVQFPGSELEWQYYPGYGLQLQVLGTFGEANGFYEAGKADYPQLAEVLNEMEQIAVPRAGGIAWEYYFNWDGGKPPWVSAMAQATGIEALANGYLATGNQGYLTEAHAALPLLETPPPTGVEVKTPLGARFLQYSFAPHMKIINAFLQTLIGLYDYTQISHDPLSASLFTAGNTQALTELPSFVVNGWSLYQPGQLDNLNYHQLVTGFLQSLCKKLSTSAYCSTYQTFQTDLATLPILTQLTTQTPASRTFHLRFRLSKPAYVGITVSRGGHRYIYTKLEFRAGTGYFKGPKLKPGTYSVAMSVTDLAGHYARVNGTLQVCRGRCPAPPVTTTTTPTTTTPTTTTPTTTTPTTTTPTTTTPTSTTPTTTTTSSGTGAGSP